jgi:competence protein ComEC
MLRFHSLQRTIAYIFMFGVLFLVACSNDVVPITKVITPPNYYHKEIPNGGTKTHFIQLTNGEAILIELENGQNVLIDTGSYSSQRELFRYLEKREIGHIDHLLLTNNSDEHMGNFTDLYKEFLVNHVYFPHQLSSLFENKAVHEEEKGLADTKFHPLKKNQEIMLDDEKNIKIKVLHPGDSLSLSPKDNSLVLQYIHGENRFLYTSDISEKTELELVEKHDLQSQILKVSDFGSSQASSPKFLAEVDAHVAIIFHRPDFYLESSVLERLEETWMDVYAIKKHGHIIIASQADDYQLFIVGEEEDFTSD